jgi:monoamine oxidase
VSTAVLAGSAIKLPSALDPWREAASLLPLGRNEKLFFEILEEKAFAPETDALGDPRDAKSGRYHIRPLGRPVVECFLGGEGARFVEEHGTEDGFAYALDQLADAFGSAVRNNLRPLAASNWSRMTYVGGAYSNALPRHAAARHALAQPFAQRIFFAGEATNARDYGTAHGAHDTGIRAAGQVIEALKPQA